MAYIVTGICVLALICVSYLLTRVKELTASDVLKSLTMILTIIGALLLIAFSFSENQISPIIGLLASIAGYILGQSGKSNS